MNGNYVKFKSSYIRAIVTWRALELEFKRCGKRVDSNLKGSGVIYDNLKTPWTKCMLTWTSIESELW